MPPSSPPCPHTNQTRAPPPERHIVCCDCGIVLRSVVFDRRPDASYARDGGGDIPNAATERAIRARANQDHGANTAATMRDYVRNLDGWRLPHIDPAVAQTLARYARLQERDAASIDAAFVRSALTLYNWQRYRQYTASLVRSVRNILGGTAPEPETAAALELSGDERRYIAGVMSQCRPFVPRAIAFVRRHFNVPRARFMRSSFFVYMCLCEFHDHMLTSDDVPGLELPTRAVTLERYRGMWDFLLHSRVRETHIDTDRAAATAGEIFRELQRGTLLLADLE